MSHTQRDTRIITKLKCPHSANLLDSVSFRSIFVFGPFSSVCAIAFFSNYFCILDWHLSCRTSAGQQWMYSCIPGTSFEASWPPHQLISFHIPLTTTGRHKMFCLIIQDNRVPSQWAFYTTWCFKIFLDFLPKL